MHQIIRGLSKIHQQEFVHCDFHHGNILYPYFNQSILSISDLGLCKPLDYFQSSLKTNDIYGVLPFIAPEILKFKPYTAASDIYSFSMIMWEFISGIPPFNDKEHNLYLALDICKGERPEIFKNIPQCYIDLMKRCWNENPLKRPNALEVCNIIENWYNNIHMNTDIKNISKELKNNIKEFYRADKSLKQMQTHILTIKSHPQAHQVSHLLDFTEKLNAILKDDDNQNNEVYGLHETGIQNIGNYY